MVFEVTRVRLNPPPSLRKRLKSETRDPPRPAVDGPVVGRILGYEGGGEPNQKEGSVIRLRQGETEGVGELGK